MNKRMKAIADLAVNMLGNVAVIGIGLALYEHRWWSIVVAMIAIAVAATITWRTTHD